MVFHLLFLRGTVRTFRPTVCLDRSVAREGADEQQHAAAERCYIHNIIIENRGERRNIIIILFPVQCVQRDVIGRQ